VDLIPSDKLVAANYLIANNNAIYFSNAGQPSAVHIQGDKITMIEQSGPPLGTAITSEYIDTEIEMEKGDKFVLLTDGAIEAPDADDEIYGIERLNALIKKHSRVEGEKLSSVILEDVLEYSGSFSDDDISVIVLEKI
jgi:sigma-B regulation protein RsbU (phosphoserine phosphatase)